MAQAVESTNEATQLPAVESRIAQTPLPPPALDRVFHERRWLVFIILLYTILCLFYNLLTPIGEGPDELDHIRYVEYLVRFGSFPPIRTGTSQPPYTIEAKQAPAYYAINAGVMLALGRSGKSLAPELSQTSQAEFERTRMRYIHTPIPPDLVPWTYIMRLVGALFGIATIILTYATVREVFPRPEEAPLSISAAAMVGLLPQVTFLSSVVNNDNFAKLVGASVAYTLVRLLLRGVTWRRAASLGILLGVLLLSKQNNLIYVPVSLLTLLLPALPRFRPASGATSSWRLWAGAWLRFLKARLPIVVLVATLAFAIGGWWYARNVLLYDDILARSAVNEMVREAMPTYITVIDMSDARQHAKGLLITASTHFAWFGWESVPAPIPLYLMYFALLFMSVVGLIIEVLRHQLTGNQAACLMLALLVFELFYISQIYQSFWRGRFLFPALVLTSLLAARGTYTWMSVLIRNQSAYVSSAIVWVVFLIISNLYCLLGALVPTFYRG